MKRSTGTCFCCQRTESQTRQGQTLRKAYNIFSSNWNSHLELERGLDFMVLVTSHQGSFHEDFAALS